MKGGRGWMGTVAFLVACVVVIGAVRWWFGGVAPTPEAFAAHASLDEALASEAQNGRPVLVFATADWCGPCQMLKRGALADPAVTAAIRAGYNPAYVDLTTGEGPDAEQAARMLQVGAVPVLIVLAEGEIAARLEGVVGATELAAWLELHRGAGSDRLPAEVNSAG